MGIQSRQEARSKPAAAVAGGSTVVEAQAGPVGPNTVVAAAAEGSIEQAAVVRTAALEGCTAVLVRHIVAAVGIDTAEQVAVEWTARQPRPHWSEAMAATAVVVQVPRSRRRPLASSALGQ